MTWQPLRCLSAWQLRSMACLSSPDVEAAIIGFPTSTTIAQGWANNRKPRIVSRGNLLKQILLRPLPLALLLLPISIDALKAQDPPKVVRLQAGEQLRHIYLTVRQNYVVPEAVTVEEGWYQVHLLNPEGVASKRRFEIDDEQGKPLAVSETDDKSPVTRVLYRFAAGKHTIKLDSKKTWTVTVTVQSKKP